MSNPPDNPNNLYSDTPLIGVGILERHQRCITGNANPSIATVGNTENEGKQFQLGTTVLLGAKSGYTAQGTRRLAMFVIATKKQGIAVLANNQCTVTYPTVAVASVAAGNWLNPSADFRFNDHGWVIQNTAIV